MIGAVDLMAKSILRQSHELDLNGKRVLVDCNRRIGIKTDCWKHPLRNVQVGSLVPDYLLQPTSHWKFAGIG